jgi:hypothetical protein
MPMIVPDVQKRVRDALAIDYGKYLKEGQKFDETPLAKLSDKIVAEVIAEIKKATMTGTTASACTAGGAVGTCVITNIT